MNHRPVEEWPADKRIAVVKRMFDEISPTYDLMNRIMSARRDVAWRRFLVRQLSQDVRRVLDVATGTGDVVLDTASRRPETTVIGVDFVKRMLDSAVVKTARKDLSSRIHYAAADAMILPFPDACFDAVTSAFAMRNIPDRLGALREMARVVRPGGKVLVLEMTFPRSLRLQRFFFWYLNVIIPLLGRLVAKHSAAYRYLPESIQGFLHPDRLSELFVEAGFTEVQAFPLTFGIACLHEGIVP